MQQLTLKQARAYNRSILPKTNQQHTQQIKRWYDRGYYMCSDGNWYSWNVAKKQHDAKYYTGA